MRKAMGAAVTALTLVMAGCGTASGGMYMDGVSLKNVDQGLASVEKAWRGGLTGGKIGVRFGDNARCYLRQLRVDDQKRKEAASTALCGPYRKLGDAVTQWDAVPVKVTSNDGGSSGGIDPNGNAGAVTPDKGATYLREDDKRPDFGTVVAEPDAPAAAFGEIVTLGAPEAQALPAGDQLRLPGVAYSISHAAGPRAGAGEQRRQAPAGGTFISVMVNPQSTSSGYYGGSSTDVSSATWAVTAGGKSYPLPDLARNGGAAAVAVPGDGKDAAITLTFDGLTQQIDASGKRVGDKAAGLYTTFSSPSASIDDFTSGAKDKPGSYAKVTVSSEQVTTKGYDKDLKWPSDGKTWVQISSYARIDTLQYSKGTGIFDSQSYYSSETLTDGGEWKCGDTPAKKVTVGSGTLTLWCELPAKTGAYQISGKLKAHGEKGSYGEDWAPDSQDVTATITGTVTLS